MNTYNTYAQLLCWSLNFLFGDILIAVVIMVCLSSLMVVFGVPASKSGQHSAVQCSATQLCLARVKCDSSYNFQILLNTFRADINACNRGTNWTALHCATFQGHGKVVMSLLNHNPDLSIRDNLGR